MKSKFYVVRQGVDNITGEKVKNLIVDNFHDVNKYTKGVKNALYYSFKNYKEAVDFIDKGESFNPKSNKVYVVSYGLDIETGAVIRNKIVYDWETTRRYTKGISGSEFRSFNSKEEALDYLLKKSEMMYKDKDICPEDVLQCYIDGSYNSEKGICSYGLVCVYNNMVLHLDSGLIEDINAHKLWQVWGELYGAIMGLKYAKKMGYKKVAIMHDYKGVFYHAVGEWERRNEYTNRYYNWYQNFKVENPNIEVLFYKVQAHSGDEFNIIADGLAKREVMNKPEDIFVKLLRKHKCYEYNTI